MPEPTISEIEQINIAQRELDVRKAAVMLDAIGAVEAAVNSTGGKAFIKAIREASESMVESSSRNALMSLLGTISSLPMAMQFEKSQFEQFVTPPVVTPAA